MAELMEIIEFLDNTGNVMVQRVPEEGSGEIKYGAQLIVRESQKAIFFRDGKSLDVFSAGRHVLKTQNVPLLTKKLTSLGYGKESPFKSEVYFLNMKLFNNLKWGTLEPILFRDSELKMIRIKSFGSFSIQIVEPTLFLNKIVGTQGVYKDTDIVSYIKSMILQKLNVVLGEIMKTVLDMPASFDNISIKIKNTLRLDFEGLGLDLHDFFINSISVPPEVQKMIDTRSGLSALGNMDEYMKYQMAKSIEKAAENPSGMASGGMGMGAGLGMGFMMPQMIQGAMQPGYQNQQQYAAPQAQAPVQAPVQTPPAQAEAPQAQAPIIPQNDPPATTQQAPSIVEQQQEQMSSNIQESSPNIEQTETVHEDTKIEDNITETTDATSVSKPIEDPFEKIKKLKQLMEMDIISKEEFNEYKTKFLENL